MTKDQEPQKPQPPKKPIVPGWDAPAKPEYMEKADKRIFTDLRKK